MRLVFRPQHTSRRRRLTTPLPQKIPHGRTHRHLFKHPSHAAQDAPDIPNAVRRMLASTFTRRTATLRSSLTSADGSTTKLLLRLADGLDVEAVVMRYDTSLAPPDAADEVAAALTGCGDAGTTRHKRTTGGKRATLCVSSEAGCAMGCTFCATGTMGLLGDLTAGEIIEQLDWAAEVLGEGGEPPPRNVVFMVSDGESVLFLASLVFNLHGRVLHAVPRRPPVVAHVPASHENETKKQGMGEPLNNYPAVRAAASMMTNPARWGLRRSGVTISTVGVIPRLADLAADLPGVSLALSLHAPTQDGRAAIVPSARAYPLPKLMAALDAYCETTGQRVFVEYVLLAGVNDRPADAADLAALLAGRSVSLNLIPWNPVHAAADADAGSPAAPMTFSAPDPGSVAAFAATVRAAGVPVTVRAEKGQDIAGACGQLVVQAAGIGSGGGGCAAGGAPKDVEDLVPRTPATT
jgi:adenine C2-methylase RlmN of 23S rRNA A2503 and tRNA A37